MRLHIVLALSVVAASCASAQTPIDYRHLITKAASVESAAPASIDSSGTTASFDGFHVKVETGTAGLLLTMRNTTNSMVIIDWPDSALVLGDGTSSAISNGQFSTMNIFGNKMWTLTGYVQKTVIPPASTVVIAVFPATRMDLNWRDNTPPAGGIIVDAQDCFAADKAEADSKAKKYIGMEARIVLAADIEGKRSNKSITVKLSGYSFSGPARQPTQEAY